MFQGLLLCPMALEAQIPVPDPAVALTPGLLWSEEPRPCEDSLALPWASPGPSRMSDLMCFAQGLPAHSWRLSLFRVH